MLRKAGPAIACHEVSTHTLPALRSARARRILRLLERRHLDRALAFLDLAFLDKVGHPLGPCARLTRASTWAALQTKHGVPGPT
jgi:hypothetical protein